jgi:hypothetical protein
VRDLISHPDKIMGKIITMSVVATEMMMMMMAG